jgi:3-oxoacyl-[acyl-carrier protein] reductase
VSQSSERAANKLVDEIKSKSGIAVCIRVDVTRLDGPHLLLEATRKSFNIEKIDILVNNAGLGQNTPLKDITVEEYDRLMNVNVRGIIFMTKEVMSHINRGGRIVNLSSISARGGYTTQSVYAATKAAVEGLTRVWATELGQEYGVTVNAVNPGPVDTEMYRAAGPVHLARMEEQNKKTPASPRCGTPEDIADVVTFLCEERSRWVTGDVICANGGMLYL